jgi:FkbM family methyltransferase
MVFNLGELRRWHLDLVLLNALVRPRGRHRLVDYGIALLPEMILQTDANCYSVGVGEDVDFERRLSGESRAKQWLFDPTPRSIRFMSRSESKILRAEFRSVGVWKQDTRMRFHAPRSALHVSHSITESVGNDQGFDADCRTVRSLMKELGHESLQLIKLNVEGAEDQIIESMLQDGIRPNVIITTWEGHDAFRKAIRWTRRLREAGWDFAGRKGWYFTYVRAR